MYSSLICLYNGSEHELFHNFCWYHEISYQRIPRHNNQPYQIHHEDHGNHHQYHQVLHNGYKIFDINFIINIINTITIIIMAIIVITINIIKSWSITMKLYGIKFLTIAIIIAITIAIAISIVIAIIKIIKLPFSDMAKRFVII